MKLKEVGEERGDRKERKSISMKNRSKIIHQVGVGMLADACESEL
jgi:hypothetical protein